MRRSIGRLIRWSGRKGKRERRQSEKERRERLVKERESKQKGRMMQRQRNLHLRPIFRSQK
jgi:hypothetical protein